MITKLMKAKERPLSMLTWPMWAEVKFDGVRIGISVHPDRTVVLHTYNGKEVPCPDLEQAFKYKRAGVYDGELIYSDGKQDKRTKISGAVNSAIHGGILRMHDKTFVVFDYIDPDRPQMVYEDRGAVIDWELNKTKHVQIVVRELMYTEKDVNTLYTYLVNTGFEGLMLKTPKHLYDGKRSNNWVKMKETKTVDLHCVGTTEGTGKYEGMIGALECEGTVEDLLITVAVGSGMTDQDRSKNPAEYIGKTIEVKYNSVTSNAQGTYSLFLPRYNCVRFDK